MIVTERIWRTVPQPYLRLLPQGIGVSRRGRSVRLERAYTDFGCEHSFGHAASRVLEHYGFAIDSSAMRQATLAQAQRATKRLEQQYQEPVRILPSLGAEPVVAETDGTMSCTLAPGKRPRAWKEIRLTAAQAQGNEPTFYAATFGAVDEVGRRWGHCARSAGGGVEQPDSRRGRWSGVDSVADAPGVRAPGQLLGDFDHVSEYWGVAAPACRASAPDRGHRTQQARLKRGALEKVVAALAPHLEPAPRRRRRPPYAMGIVIRPTAPTAWIIAGRSHWACPLERE